jgi:hypothetical protein
LSFGVDRVEGQGGFSRPAHAGDDDELPDRQRDVDILEVVGASAADDEIAGLGAGGSGVGHAWDDLRARAQPDRAHEKFGAT